MSEIIWYLSFSDWLISLSIVFSGGGGVDWKRLAKEHICLYTKPLEMQWRPAGGGGLVDEGKRGGKWGTSVIVSTIKENFKELLYRLDKKLKKIWQITIQVTGKPVTMQKFYLFNMIISPLLPFDLNCPHPAPWLTLFLLYSTTPLTSRLSGQWGSGRYQIILETKSPVCWPQRQSFHQIENI